MTFNRASFSDELYKFLNEMINEHKDPAIAKSPQQNISQFEKKSLFNNDPNYPEA